MGSRERSLSLKRFPASSVPWTHTINTQQQPQLYWRRSHLCGLFTLSACRLGRDSMPLDTEAGTCCAPGAHLDCRDGETFLLFKCTECGRQVLLRELKDYCQEGFARNCLRHFRGAEFSCESPYPARCQNTHLKYSRSDCLNPHCQQMIN